MKKSASKKTLIASAAAISLSALLFAGTTYAWFTDSASSATSTIQSGNLDVNLYKGEVVTVEGTETASATSTLKYTAVGTNTTVFDKKDNWEPGVVSVQYLQVKNEGSLALDYKLTVDITNNKTGLSVTNKEIDLTKILKAAVVTADAPFTSRADAIKAAEDANSVTLEELQAYTGKLVSGTNGSAQLAVIIYMPETVDNDANNDGENVPSVDLGVTVEAKQTKEENDSYGNDYDADATYSGAMKVKDGEVDNTDALNPVVLEGDATLTATTANSLAIDLGGYTLNSAGLENSTCLLNGDEVSVNLSNGTVKAAATDTDSSPVIGINAISLNMTVENVTFESASESSALKYPAAIAAALTSGTVTFKNCTFDKTMVSLGSQSGDVNIVFENCKFIAGSGDSVKYSFNYYNDGGTITFKQCTYSLDGETFTLLTFDNYKNVIDGYDQTNSPAPSFE
jgi:predicted ribosomally synthesized peptide with SipW-like signal peptide